MKNKELDHVDREILQHVAGKCENVIERHCGSSVLSSPAVSVRIDNMIEAGYIEGFHATVNPVKMGYHIKAFINLEVSPIDKEQFYPYIKACPNVVECNCVTGDYSMLLEVWFPSTHELNQFIGELQQYGRTKTLIVFSTSVEHRGVHVDGGFYDGKAR